MCVLRDRFVCMCVVVVLFVLVCAAGASGVDS